ncbi:MAG: ATP synthase F1 subunit epsilon [Lachnospiraceae bacterium]|nr:ATP synthase F1 subunit epsilon [Lachnospiraceae bacterium]
MSNTFVCHIYEADGTFFEGEIVSLVVPTIAGKYGVMAHHRNVVVALTPGICHFTHPDGRVEYASVSEGMMRVENNDVLLLVDSAEHPDEIDEVRAKKAEAQAMEAKLQKKSIEEYYIAEASLKRAMSRLKLAGKNRGEGL